MTGRRNAEPLGAPGGRLLVARLRSIAVVLVRQWALPFFRRRARASGPVRLRRTFESLGGAWAKLGQLLALRFDLLPEAYCEELFKLLNRSAPLAFDSVERVVREELGGEVGELFASFEREPLGAASIAQVHAATLADGRRVAVKVQRPGVAAAMAADLTIMRVAAWVIDRTRLLGATRVSELVAELSRWTGEELDFWIEAAHAEELRATIREPARCHIPAVHPDRTGRRVLTTDLLEGEVLVDVIGDLRADRRQAERRLRARGHDPERVATNVVLNFLDQVYAVGLFHGDLHPANLLVLGGDRIGYVDFGIVGHIPPALHETLGRYAMALFGGDAGTAIDELLAWLRPTRRTDRPRARAEMIARAERFFADLEREPGGRRELLARFQLDLLAAARRHRLAADPRLALYLKALLTIDAVTSELAPDLNVQELHVQFFGRLVVEGIQSGQGRAK